MFAKVAQAVTALVDSNEKTSAEALLELSTLVNAILYTQGETGLAGELQPIETTDLGQQQTQTLGPRAQAVARSADHDRLGPDGDHQGRPRARRVPRPAAGQPGPGGARRSLSRNRATSSPRKCCRSTARRSCRSCGRSSTSRATAGISAGLALMHRLDPEGTRETVKQALDEGSKEVKVVAIECLGDTPDDLSFLLEQAKAKAKDVRAAAFKALGKSQRGRRRRRRSASAVRGADLELAVEPVRIQSAIRKC